MVNCEPNSNFNALYASIGHAIDLALGFSDNYERLVDSINGLANKARKIRDLIERFGIGIIILDEIQLIDFKSTRESSFESLMIITNNTKVAFAAVGTEEAYSTMFSKLRTARRIGSLIHANTYCSNRAFFDHMLSDLWHYQYFNNPVKLTNSLSDALFKYSHGIIDQLIGIYQYMNIDYLMASSKCKPKIDASFVKKTAVKHYNGLLDLLNNLDDPEVEKKRRKIMEEARTEIDKINDRMAQSMYSSELIENDMNNDLLMMKQYVVRTILTLTDQYNVATIQDAIAKQISRISEDELNNKSLLRATIQSLSSTSDLKNKFSKTKGTAPSKTDLAEFLGL